MAAITWSNVNAPSNSDAVRLLEGSQKSLNAGLDSFSAAIANRENANQGVADRGRQASQEDYLNMVSGYKTPEDLRAAQMSGVLDQRLAALDPRNQAAVRGAADARVTSLQKQTTEGNTFNNAQADNRDEPIKQQHAMLVASGDTAGAAELVASNPQVRVWSISMENAYDSALKQGQDANQTAADNRKNEVANAEQPGKIADAAQNIALAKVNNPVDLANALAKADLAAGANEQAKQTQINAGVALNNTARSNTENATDLLFMQLGTEAASAVNNSLADSSSSVGQLAAEMNLPVNAAGGPDIANISKVDRAALNAKAKERGLPSLDQLITGNTQQGNAFIKRISEDPRFNAADIVRNRAKILSLFDTSGSNNAIGNDAYEIRLQQAKEQVNQAEQAKTNWYAPGNPDAMQSYDSLAKDVDAMFKGTDMEEDLQDIQNFLYKAATTGIEVSKGNFLTPSRQDMLAAIRSEIGTNNVFNKSRADDIEAFLKKNMNTSRVTQLLQQAEASRQVARTTAVRNLMASPASAGK